jgi:hypothetical protein
LVRNVLDEPVPGTKVTLREKSHDGKVIWETETDADGRFRFPQQPVGEYYLIAEAHGYPRNATPVVVTNFGSDQDGIVWTLKFGPDCGGAVSRRFPKPRKKP